MAEPPVVEASAHKVASVDADLLVLPVLEGPAPGPGVAEAGASLGLDLTEVFRRHGLRGKAGESLLLPGGASLVARSVLLIGVGPETSVSAQTVREAAMRSGAASRRYPVVASTLGRLGPSPRSSAAAFAEGFLIGAATFDRHKRERQPTSERVLGLGAANAAVKRALHQGEILGAATNLARELTYMSASEATPAFLAGEARRIAERSGADLRMWTSDDLEREGFGGVLAVGAGSEHEPCMVELTYERGRGAPIALTGKGVTFDSGGLSLKRKDIEWMRSDMASAAAALATLWAVARLELKVNLVVAVAFAENMPGAAATRPGDVIRHRGGRTSEVLDTDAEGRVLLADMLAYLSERPPSVLLDSGTLTDAGGLGPDLWAVMGTDHDLAVELIRAGDDGGDRGWELPLWRPYRTLIESEVADVKNVGDHWTDSSILCGLFLRDFVGADVPWLHLDTGSSGWMEHASDLWAEGATGSPTRAFVRFIARRARSPLP